jgi:hypothetical protein
VPGGGPDGRRTVKRTFKAYAERGTRERQPEMRSGSRHRPACPGQAHGEATAKDAMQPGAPPPAADKYVALRASRSS